MSLRPRYHVFVTSPEGSDLGHGVRAVQQMNGGLVVYSEELDLGWKARRGQVVGSAVLWNEGAYEVVHIQTVGRRKVWRLDPWRNEEAMRTVFHLDGETVSAVRLADELARRARRLHGGSVLFIPILGLVPAAMQRRWRDEWSFPAGTATTVSAIAEIAGGGLGLLQNLTVLAGAEWFLPAWLRWLVIVGPILCIEGVVRLKMCAADGEPVGSFLGLPLAILGPRESRGREELELRPHLRCLDEEAGILELWSPIVRKDWVEEGVLLYRGRDFRMLSLASSGRGWLYRFSRETEPGEADHEVRERLRLLPAPSPVAASRPRERGSGYARTALVTAAMCLARRNHQERWAAELGTRPSTFTLLGAGAEVVGGLVNLGHSGAAGLGGLLNLSLGFEGVARLVAMVVTGRPVGSLLAWPFSGLYERMLSASSERSGEQSDA